MKCTVAMLLMRFVGVSGPCILHVHRILLCAALCRARRRLRRAHKRFPTDPPQCILANESYDDSEEELYSKPNRGMGGYEPANPVLVFRNESSEDVLAYDMFIAGKQ